MLSKTIKDLSVFFSLSISFEVEWHNLCLPNGIRAIVMGLTHGSVIVREGLIVGSQFDSLQPL